MILRHVSVATQCAGAAGADCARCTARHKRAICARCRASAPAAAPWRATPRCASCYVAAAAAWQPTAQRDAPTRRTTSTHASSNNNNSSRSSSSVSGAPAFAGNEHCSDTCGKGCLPDSRSMRFPAAASGGGGALQTPPWNGGALHAKKQPAGGVPLLTVMSAARHWICHW